MLRCNLIRRVQNSSGHGERICVAIAAEKGHITGEFGPYLRVTRAGLSRYLRGVAEGDPIIFQSAFLTPANSLKCYLGSLQLNGTQLFHPKRTVSVKIAKRAKDQNVPFLVAGKLTTIYGPPIFYAKLKCMRNENCGK